MKQTNDKVPKLDSSVPVNLHLLLEMHFLICVPKGLWVEIALTTTVKYLTNPIAVACLLAYIAYC